MKSEQKISPKNRLEIFSTKSRFNDELLLAYVHMCFGAIFSTGNCRVVRIHCGSIEREPIHHFNVSKTIERKRYDRPKSHKTVNSANSHRRNN